MSNLTEAFEIQANPENIDFVRFPYQSFQRVMGDSGNKELIDNRLMTIPRSFDIKHGTKTKTICPK